MERETQHFSALAVRERLLDMMTALDALLKAKRLRKRLDGFQKSDSLADIDMLDKLQKMDSVIDELLESEASLPEIEELSKQIQEVQLLYRRQTKEALRSCPDKAPTADSSRSADSGKSKPLYGLPKTDMPVFEGEPKMWCKFWERFTQRLAMHPDLPASEKIAQLEQAIKPIDGKALISAPKRTETEYKECIKNLRQRYDQPRKIYRTYVHEVIDHVTPHTRRGLYTLDTVLQEAITGLALYGGMDAGSVLVAVAERGLSQTTMVQWNAHCAREGVAPTLEAFRQFIRRKAEELDEEDPHSRSTTPSKATTPPKATVPSRQSNNQSRRPSRNTVFHVKEKTSGCKLCGDLYHMIYLCPEFKGQTAEQRLATVQRLKICSNCLSTDHSSRNCQSKRSCRICGRRHNTLLHQNDVQPSTTYHSQPEASAQPPPQQYYYPLPVPQHLQYPYPPPMAPHPQPPSTLVSTTDPVCNTANSSTAMILGDHFKDAQNIRTNSCNRVSADSNSC